MIIITQYSKKYKIVNNKKRHIKQNQMQQKHATYKNIKDFVNKTRKLITQEQQAQRKQFIKMTSQKNICQIQQQGAGLSNMMILNSKEGFYDKIIITLAKNCYSEKNKVEIPAHCKLQAGDDVAIYSGDSMIAQGVIYRRTLQKIKISIRVDQQDTQDYQDMKVNLILKWNQVTYRRYIRVLDMMQNSQSDIPLAHIFFTSSAKGYRCKIGQCHQYQKMNQQQNIAISNGLVQQCHLIYGPPGTGKTTTVCQLIVQAVKNGQKVLACAPSNIAVDNIVEGISRRVNCVRIGNSARIINEVIQRCLDFLISKNENIWKNQQKKLNAAQKKLKRTKDKAQRKQIYSQIKQIRNELTTLHKQVIQQIITDAEVICCTNVGVGDKVLQKYLEKKKFDLIVIDQCGQGLEVSCWIAIAKGCKRIVLAGDHKQLSPTVKFQEGSLLSYTLFSRCMEQLKYLSSTMLQVQYRMNKAIMGWSNSMFYGNKLIAHESVENHTLKQIYNEVEEELSTLMMIDTAGCEVGEQGGKMQSKMNVGEADIACHIYRKLIKFGVRSKDIAILTPYSKQVTLIKNILIQHQCQSPEVSTVDGIQGRQKQCIIISMVRSNSKKQIGFLKDWRRMNVAITRARRMLIIIGDSDCISSDQNIKQLILWIQQNGHIQTAQFFKSDPTIRFGLGQFCKNVKKDKDKDQDNVGFKKKKKNKKDKKNKQQTSKNGNQDQDKLQGKQQYKHQQHTNQDQQNLKNKYRTALFSLQKKLVFQNLNAYQRKMMHQVAQQYGYQHITNEDKTKITIKPVNLQKNDKQQIDKEKQNNKVQKKLEHKKINIQNNTFNRADIVGEQSSEEQQAPQNHKTTQPQKLSQPLPQQCPQQKPKPEKKPKKKQKKNQKQTQDIQQDWQKLLSQLQANLPKKDQCFKCNKKISSVTAVQCKYCKRYFCRHDVLAEEHGCEDEARQYARKDNIDRYLEEGVKKMKQKIKQQQDRRRKKQKQPKNTKK